MRSVLISIKPKWCELIVRGKKTAEMRKSAPKEAPFKAYIYCTNSRFDITNIDDLASEYVRIVSEGRGKVIGEFVCNEVEKFNVGSLRSDDIEELACVSYAELINYFYKPYELDGKTAKQGYAWHISDLKIYDTPKRLCEFVAPCRVHKSKPDESCRGCPYIFKGATTGKLTCDRSVKRPPQSWRFLEGE